LSYFLDTNICIWALKGTFPKIAGRLRRHAPNSIKISAIVKAELLYGAERSARPARNLPIVEAFLFPFEVVPFCDDSAAVYAGIRRELEAKGKVTGPNDLLIAATVLANRGVLVTHNVREFKRVRGLKTQDWTK